MTPHDLLANFETLAEAPHGIRRLRELVLELAVRGKLIEQDPGEESAIELLKQIRAEKTRLIASAAIRGGKHLPEVGQDEAPFEIPPTWRWSRLRSITRDLGQKVPDAPFSYVDVGSIDNQAGQITGSPDVLGPSEAPSRARKLVSLGTVIFSTVRPYLMNIAIVKKEFDPSPIVSTAFAVLHPFQGIDSTFLFWVLRSPFFTAWVGERAKGVAYPAISDGDLQFAPIPIPPTTEQRRIVARVDELMALLDRLDAKRQEREAARTAARDSALASLREAPTPDDVETAWLRIQERFHELFATPEDVASLRQAVLQLAVSGRLVERGPDCTGAEAFLDAIRGERRLMVKSGLIKVPKPCAPLADDELPFHPPKGWVWCRLGDLVSEGPTNGWSPTTVDYPTKVKTLALSATTKGWFDASRFKYVDAEVPSDSPLWLLPGDLLIQRSNTRDYVGMPAVFNGAPGEFIYPDLMMRCRFPASVSIPYVHLFLLSTYGRSFIQSKASGTSSSMVKVGQEVVRSIPVALPPAEEQLRILEAMSSFNRALDRLVASLNEATGLSDGFAAAAVHHLDA